MPRRGGPGFSPVPLCPCRSVVGKELRPLKMPPPSPGADRLGVEAPGQSRRDPSREALSSRDLTC